MNKENLIKEIAELNALLQSKLKELCELEISPKTIEEAYREYIMFGESSFLKENLK